MVNPHAGGGRCRRQAQAALERLRRSGLELEVHTTQQHWEAVRIARDAYLSGFRRFLAVGGDGTAFEVLNGFLPLALDRGDDCELGLLPLGTGNSFVEHFARRSGVPSLELALRALEQGAARRCDVLRIERRSGEHLALGSIAFGLAALAAQRFNRRLRRLGLVGYTAALLRELVDLHAQDLHLRVSHRGEHSSVHQGTVLSAVQSVSMIGGTMAIAPSADPTDGSAELVVVGKLSRLGVLRAFPRVFKGTHVTHPAVSIVPFQRLLFQDSTPGPVMVDGEVMEMAPTAIDVLPGALSVLI